MGLLSTAMVTLDMQTSFPSSFVIFISHTWELLPR